MTLAAGAVAFVPDSIHITNITPRAGDAKGGTQVTVTGSGFAQGASVAFGYAPAIGGFRYATKVAVSDGTAISATTPAHEPGTVDVIVTNPDGNSVVATAAFSFK